MRSVMVACLMALNFAVVPSSQTSNPDPYSIGIVSGALRMQSTGVFTTWTGKNMVRLGDDVSVAILKIYPEKDLASPKTVESFLPLIREAFSEPQFISLDVNKEPQVTMLLLNHLLSIVRDSAQHREIQQTIDYVRARVKNQSAKKSS